MSDKPEGPGEPPDVCPECDWPEGKHRLHCSWHDPETCVTCAEHDDPGDYIETREDDAAK